jgi:hypothetical protein
MWKTLLPGPRKNCLQNNIKNATKSESFSTFVFFLLEELFDKEKNGLDNIFFAGWQQWLGKGKKEDNLGSLFCENVIFD